MFYEVENMTAGLVGSCGSLLSDYVLVILLLMSGSLNEPPA